MATDHQQPPTGPQPLAEVAAKVVAETRLRRKARMLADRPPRLLIEVIVALAKMHGDLQEAENIVGDHLRVPDVWLDELDCRDAPPVPIHIVSRRNGQAG